MDGFWRMVVLLKFACGSSIKHNRSKSASTSVEQYCSSKVKRLIYGTWLAQTAGFTVGVAVTVLMLVLTLVTVEVVRLV